MWVVLAVAVVVRVAFFAATEFQAQAALDPLDDERHAISIARGGGYPDSIVADGPTALRPPAYPYPLPAARPAGHRARGHRGRLG
jgi:hypothetical protein